MLSQEWKQGDVTVSDHVVRDSYGWGLSNKESDMKRAGGRTFLGKETASNAQTNLVSSDHVTLFRWLLSHPEGKPKSSPWSPKPAWSAFPHSAPLTWWLSAPSHWPPPCSPNAQSVLRSWHWLLPLGELSSAPCAHSRSPHLSGCAPMPFFQWCPPWPSYLKSSMCSLLVLLSCLTWSLFLHHLKPCNTHPHRPQTQGVSR